MRSKKVLRAIGVFSRIYWSHKKKTQKSEWFRIMLVSFEIPALVFFYFVSRDKNKKIGEQPVNRSCFNVCLNNFK